MPEREPAPDPRRPCPRCDYDLSGEVETWAESCPLRGRCPECGLVVEWGCVLDPRLSAPRWSFEHAESKSFSILRRRVSTLLMCLRPWRFWRELRMEHQIRPKRLVGIAFFVMLLSSLLLGLANCANYYYLQSRGSHLVLSWGRYWEAPQQRPFPTWRNDLAQMLFPFGSQSIVRSTDIPWIWLAYVAVWTALVPAAYAVLRQTRRMCRVRAAHLARVTVYVIPMIGVLFVMQLLVLVVESPMSPLRWRIRSGGWINSLIETVRHPAFTFVVTLIFLNAWWYFATCRYLKFPHALAVSFCMVQLGLLAGTAIASYTFGERFLFDIALMFSDALAP